MTEIDGNASAAAGQGDRIADWRASSQGLAAVRDFDLADDRRNCDQAQSIPMSASTSSGRTTASALVRVVPTLDFYEKVGDELLAQGKLEEALKSYRDSLAIRERVAAASGLSDT
jgi:hypothetical protein